MKDIVRFDLVKINRGEKNFANALRRVLRSMKKIELYHVHW